MKKITKIEFVNYKAFYGEGESNQINIDSGKNVLIYGENGSGKSTIYEGLRQFFNSSDETIEVVPSRNILIQETYKINEGTSEEETITSKVCVKITFMDEHKNFEEKVFGVPEENVKRTIFIKKANLLNSFLSYRELLKTYLMDNLKDKAEFRKKFAELLIEHILADKINEITQHKYKKDWQTLFRSRGRYDSKKGLLTKFNIGLINDISKINLFLNLILNYFDSSLSIEILNILSDINYSFSAKKNKELLHPKYEIDLKVHIDGVNVENKEENHLTVLNEARLSALAISIYLSALVLTPQDNFDYKILFFDDIFIGLDMSNRLPLLKILSEFKKPILEKYFTESGTLAERIVKKEGVIQCESVPFFQSYQIFISTYDRTWFNVAKDKFDTFEKDKWHTIELYTEKRKGIGFNVPVVYSSLNDLEKSLFYFTRHDYPTSANYLRKALERKVKQLLPLNYHYHEYTDKEAGVNVVEKMKTLSQYLDRFISYCSELKIDINELNELKNLKDWYFNPFSHDNITTPIFRLELERAINLVDRLYKFNQKIIVEAGQELIFQFQNSSGEFREYRLKLIENLRYFETADNKMITNIEIICFQWNKNGVIESVNWKKSNLIQFVNNKWKAFLNSEIPEGFDYLNELKLLNGSSLKSLL